MTSQYQQDIIRLTNELQDLREQLSTATDIILDHQAIHREDEKALWRNCVVAVLRTDDRFGTPVGVADKILTEYKERWGD